MKKVSVIIPTYNRASQVPGAVESVLAQTWENCEVIVIDDGSKDNTSEVLAPFMDRIRYVKTENGGVSAARNRGILEADGDWIAFLDSDDTWDPDKLAKQITAMESTGAKVCFCVSADESGAAIDDLQAMDPQLPIDGIRFYPPGDCRFFKHPGHPFLQSMIADRKVLMKGGLFDPSLRVAEDTRLIYGLVLGSGYVVVNTIFVHICRDREGPGLSDTMDGPSALRRFDCYARVQGEVWPRLVPLDREAANVVRYNLNYFVSRLAEISCGLGRMEQAKNYARAGLNFHGGWRCFVRNVLILFLPGLCRGKFSRKWKE
ncbi:MAG: glycosyltransferase [Akkermansiaceae bacterium]|jgi:glycosyltransferase involved in cell wall biosynthesis|nr:glycosyltransferase [Akkermansiaceae bacterium]